MYLISCGHVAMCAIFLGILFDEEVLGSGAIDDRRASCAAVAVSDSAERVRRYYLKSFSELSRQWLEAGAVVSRDIMRK